MRSATLLLPFVFLASPALAQDDPVYLWPPRDVGVTESFGTFTYGTDGQVLAVRSFRSFSNPFVRVYLREGLNWIEDERLLLAPLTPHDPALNDFGTTIEVDQGRILTGRAGTWLWERERKREWRRTEIADPDPDVGIEWGRALGLSGDWMAVADGEAVWTLQHQGDQWMPVQRIPAQPGVIDLDGDDLVISERNLVRVFHRSGGAFVEELATTAFTGFAAARVNEGLVVAGLGARGTTVKSWERSGAGTWTPLPDLTVSTFDSLDVDSGQLFTSRRFPRQIEVYQRSTTGWQLQRSIPKPPRLGRYLGSVFNVQAAGPVVLASVVEPPTEHISGYVGTFAVAPEARPTLVASSAQIALEEGETVTLNLDAGIENAGRPFFMGGSITGSSPGLRVAGVRVPLNRRADDPYAPVSHWHGVLDGLGRASVTIPLPVISPGDPLAFLKDRTLHHAFVVWTPGRGITHVSNVALTAMIGRRHPFP